MCGWVKLHRKLKESPVYGKPHLLTAWTHCLLSAAHKEHDTLVGLKTIRLMPGQFVTGRKRFAKETGLSEMQVRSAWSTFERMEMVKLSTSQGQVATIITVLKWDAYQNDDDDDNQAATKLQPSHNQAATKLQPLYKNDKNGNKGENETTTTPPREANASLSPTGWYAIEPEPVQPPVTEKTPTSPVDASEPTNPSGCTLMGQTSKPRRSPLEKKATPDAVMEVINAYRQIKPSDTTRGQAKKNIATRLKQGHDKETLIQCIQRYRKCVDYEPQFLKGVGNFFGNDAVYEDYLDENYTEPTVPASSRNPKEETLADIIRSYGLTPAYHPWSPEDDNVHIPTPEEDAAKWDAVVARIQKEEEEAAHVNPVAG